MTTVEVDFNNIDGYGHVRVLPGATSWALRVGDKVTAVDRLEDMEFDGRVVEILSDGGVALAMDWEASAAPLIPSLFLPQVTSLGCSFTKFPVVTVQRPKITSPSLFNREALNA